ncbi:MAG: hypothetical protein IJV15_05590 [Lachnospiraceae bacterium]|nr:hypothetical protein [Lachnospiraceae bacterium]
MNTRKIKNAPIQDELDNPSTEDELKKQYHPAFCAAMELELREDKAHLIFEDEYNLNTKPNKIDFLVINVSGNVRVKSGLGAIFKKHNLFEFKGFRDSLNERVYHRTMGYVHLYITYGDVNIPIDEITVSFLREAYPRKMMKYFEENGFAITSYDNGIYHVKRSGHIDMQVIVTSRLGNPYVWINKITSRLKPEDILQMQKEIAGLSDEIDLVNAESVVDMSISLNKDKEYLKEMMGMGALRDMFKEEFEEKDRKISDLSEQLESKDKQLQNQSEQLESKDKQLQNQSEQLESKDKQLQTEHEENIKLRKEIEELKKLVGNKIAML